MAFGRGARAGIGGRMGMGPRRGFGRGYCWNVAPYWYAPPTAPMSAEEQKQLLEAELGRLEAEKTEIQRRLTDLA